MHFQCGHVWSLVKHIQFLLTLSCSVWHVRVEREPMPMWQPLNALTKRAVFESVLSTETSGRTHDVMKCWCYCAVLLFWFQKKSLSWKGVTQYLQRCCKDSIKTCSSAKSHQKLQYQFNMSPVISAIIRPEFKLWFCSLQGEFVKLPMVHPGRFALIDINILPLNEKKAQFSPYLNWFISEYS